MATKIAWTKDMRMALLQTMVEEFGPEDISSGQWNRITEKLKAKVVAAGGNASVTKPAVQYVAPVHSPGATCDLSAYTS